MPSSPPSVAYILGLFFGSGLGSPPFLLFNPNPSLGPRAPFHLAANWKPAHGGFVSGPLPCRCFCSSGSMEVRWAGHAEMDLFPQGWLSIWVPPPCVGQGNALSWFGGAGSRRFLLTAPGQSWFRDYFFLFLDLGASTATAARTLPLSIRYLCPIYPAPPQAAMGRCPKGEEVWGGGFSPSFPWRPASHPP